ncbi:Ubiquitin recognition factor in ER-associated degradation protein 1 [Xylographa opegraphella]|nr:Ubiquitin recognition factor in ER-associated degradation protein 1 [Xylographa opegraphella]
MFGRGYLEDEMMQGMFPAEILRRAGMTAPRRFDEYYRCYPVAMLPGPERENVNHGGKVIMPPSALDKLTRLHITYPMLFELINGAKEKMTHAGVLEFIAEEGKIYLPFWLMQTLLLEPGDLLQIKSTDLPPGQFIKLQAQSTAFLDISDPKAVLENAFRNFSCLTKGDIFTFSYNDQIFEMAVLETKPTTNKNAIGVLETDLEVDFAAPIGYEEPQRASGISTPRSGSGGLPVSGLLHNQGTMAQAINYSSIAPDSSSAAAGARATSSNFLLGGQKLNARKGTKAPTPNASTPVAGSSTNPPLTTIRQTNRPQPLRLPPGKLFFGYEIKPVKKTREKKEADETKPKFQGQGVTLRGGTKRKGGDPVAAANATPRAKESTKNGPVLADHEPGGRTLRDTPR